jgi:hypothetical protein
VSLGSPAQEATKGREVAALVIAAALVVCVLILLLRRRRTPDPLQPPADVLSRLGTEPGSAVGALDPSRHPDPRGGPLAPGTPVVGYVSAGESERQLEAGADEHEARQIGHSATPDGSGSFASCETSSHDTGARERAPACDTPSRSSRPERLPASS